MQYEAGELYTCHMRQVSESVAHIRDDQVHEVTRVAGAGAGLAAQDEACCVAYRCGLREGVACWWQPPHVVAGLTASAAICCGPAALSGDDHTVE